MVAAKMAGGSPFHSIFSRAFTMKYAHRFLGILASLLTLIGTTTAAELKFAVPPQAVRSGDQWAIKFTLSAPSDVEVSLLSAKGSVVRHLAAGMLGGKEAPPAPLQAGLSQQLTWDGRDDSGQVATGGPFQVRVRAGMQAKFGRTIGGSPYTGSVVQMPYRAPVNGLAVDSDGALYIKMMSSVGSHGNSGLWPWHLRKFDRDGNYQRTLLPYPPSTPVEKASGFEVLATSDGEFTPANQNSLYPVFSRLGNEMCSRVVDGQLVFIRSESRELSFLAIDGSNRLKTIAMWPAAAKLNAPRWLDFQVAFSPDGKYAYYSNVAGTAYDGKTPADIDPAWPQGRVYRHDLTNPDSAPERFYDLELPDFAATPYWMPSAWDKKSAAAGIDTDQRGHVFVCDLVNQQIVELDPQGKRQNAVSAPWPDRVVAARKSDAVYVISRKVSRGAHAGGKLIKITGRGQQAKIVAELPLTGTMGGACTLDETGETPVLWVSGQESSAEHGGTGKLVRIADRGSEFITTGDQFLNRDPSAVTFVGYMDVDRAAELVYVTSNDGHVWRYHGETGAGGQLDLKAVDVAIGAGGQIYTWGTGSYSGPIARYSRELEPLPLAGGNAHTYGELYGRAGRGLAVCGMDVDSLGRVFATYGSNDCHVRAYDDQGQLVKFARQISVSTNRGPQEVPVAIAGVVGYGGSLRLDLAGNIYLLQHGLPEDHVPPAGFEHDEAYRQAVGTIYKFSPDGGELKQSGSTVKEVAGALAKYPGCGPVSRWRSDGSCACVKPRFDVDEFGRLYIPNGITYQVSVRDNAGNEITRFGAYGNYDCQGPASAEPRPAIPLGWPVTAGASDKYIYVGDCLNHRVVRVDKTFAAEALVDLR